MTSSSTAGRPAVATGAAVFDPTRPVLLLVHGAA